MKIIGIDVGRGSARRLHAAKAFAGGHLTTCKGALVLCCLDKLPPNISQHYKKLRREKEFYKVNCDAPGVEKLLSLKPDGIVIEPTGHWYSEFWLTVANQNGIDVHFAWACRFRPPAGTLWFSGQTR